MGIDHISFDQDGDHWVYFSRLAFYRDVKMFEGLEGFIRTVIFFATLGVILIILLVVAAVGYGLSLLGPFVSQYFEYH